MEKLTIARAHLERVQDAWLEPTDWADLCLYGFYCLEASIVAAAEHLGWEIKRNHPAKAEAAARLHSEAGLSDIEDLLYQLNTARKAEAYGDVDRPDLDAEDVAVLVEEFVEAVAELIGRGQK